MIQEIKMPSAGQTTDEATIVKVNVKVGDTVKRGDELLEAEPDKAILPVERFAAGTVLDVLVVGVSQAIATVPGISRSGMTITTGCFVGFERKFAVRFSFILSIPAILGANILSIKDAVDAGINWSEMPMYLIGVAVAAVTGYLCIRLLKMIADRGRFGAFAYYCWTVGALVLIFTIV